LVLTLVSGQAQQIFFVGLAGAGWTSFLPENQEKIPMAVVCGAGMYMVGFLYHTFVSATQMIALCNTDRSSQISVESRPLSYLDEQQTINCFYAILCGQALPGKK
jgi:hypothetical protein